MFGRVHIVTDPLQIFTNFSRKELGLIFNRLLRVVLTGRTDVNDDMRIDVTEALRDHFHIGSMTLDESLL